MCKKPLECVRNLRHVKHGAGKDVEDTTTVDRTVEELGESFILNFLFFLCLYFNFSFFCHNTYNSRPGKLFRR